MSPGAPFSSTGKGLLNVIPTTTATAQRADFFDPHTTNHTSSGNPPAHQDHKETVGNTTVLSQSSPQRSTPGSPSRLGDVERAELEQLRKVLQASAQALKEQEAAINARSQLVELKFQELSRKAERTPDERAIIAAANEQLKLREEEIEALAADLDRRSRQLEDERARLREREAIIAERDRAISIETDDVMTHVEQQASKIKAAEVLLATREAKIEVRERDVRRREELLKEAEERLSQQQKILEARHNEVEMQAEDVFRKAQLLHEQGENLSAATERLRLREEAMWRVSAVVGARVTSKPLVAVREALETTKRHLYALPSAKEAAKSLPPGSPSHT